MIIKTDKQLELAKKSAIALMQGQDITINDVFLNSTLDDVEKKIKMLNDFSGKFWLLSSLVLYSAIYNNMLYKELDISWQEYMKIAKKRINLSAREISEQLSAARFFINNHEELIKQGWTPTGCFRSLARAQLAENLSNSLKETIQHLATDTWEDFHKWYTSFKEQNVLVHNTNIRDDIIIKNKKIYLGDVEAVTISNDLSNYDKTKIFNYLLQIFEALKEGLEPTIIPVSNEEESKSLLRFRNKLKRRRK